MPSLQEELSRLSVQIPMWTENGPDAPPAPAEEVPRNGTEKILRAVALRPYATSGHVAEMLKDDVSASSVTSMMNQLFKHGYLDRTDERPAKYTRTNKPYTPADTEWRKKALEKAKEARRMKTKPLRLLPAAPAPEKPKAPDVLQLVLQSDVLTAKRVYLELKKVFCDV